MDVDALARSTSRFSEAALDPTLWPDLLQDIAGSVGACGAVLLQSGIPSEDMPWSPSLSRQREIYYGEGWNRRDLRAMRSVSAFRRGLVVVADEDLVSREEMDREPFYNSYLASQGTEAFAAVGFRLSSAEMCGLVIQRTPSQGAFSAREKELLAHLAPRLTATAELARLLAEAAVRSSMTTLDRLSRPAVALGRRGTVIAHNAAAEALFDRDFDVRAGTLAVRDPLAAAEIRDACEPARPSPPPPRTIVVRREGRLPLLLNLLPLDGPAGGFVFGAGSMITILDPHAAPSLDPALLQRLFGTTAAETRLCLRLSEGLSLRSAAEAGGVSTETARSQLKEVFAKTGVRRQADLVALLSRLGR